MLSVSPMPATMAETIAYPITRYPKQIFSNWRRAFALGLLLLLLLVSDQALPIRQANRSADPIANMASASDGFAKIATTQSAPEPNDPRLLLSALFSTTLPTAQLPLVTEQTAPVLTQAKRQLDLPKQLAPIAPFLPLLGTGVQLGNALPTLLGFNGAKTYLILVQNNHELRATGGFISAIGKLTLDKAQVVGLEFTDSYNLFRQDAAYPQAPEAMQRYMGVPLLLLRDANWSPDLPTTAKLVKALYAQDTGVTIDGIATVDLRAVQLIVGALGSLTVPGAPTPITGANIVEQIKQFWAKPLGTDDTLQTKGMEGWWGQRKDFIPALAKAARQQLQSGRINYWGLLQNTEQALNERAIQIWLAEPMAAEQLATLGWDGGLHPQPEADFLALVDTNMGYNKVNAVLKRSLSYTVTWPTDPTQPALATAAIQYTNPVTQTDPVCAATPYYGENYDDMIQRCYFDYVRLYVPGESKLVGLEGVEPDSVSTQRGEHGLRVLAGYFVLKPGEEKTITFRYQLPTRLTVPHYALLIQRQAGTGPLPLTVQVGTHTTSTNLTAGQLSWSP